MKLEFGDLAAKAAAFAEVADEKHRRKTFDRRVMLAARMIVHVKMTRTKVVKKYGADAVLEAERRLQAREGEQT